MKLKGKALLSLLMVLTLVLQLFSVSAFAEGQVNGSEPLIYAVYARDESGAVVQVSAEDEHLLENKSYSVTVGDKQVNRSPFDAVMSDLMNSDLRITPPDGWYVAKAWLYGDSYADSVALPLTAVNPNSMPATAVTLDRNDCIAYVQDGWNNIFDDSLVSSFGGMYTLGVYFEKLDDSNVLGGSYAAGQTVTTDYGDASQGFVGWELRYPINGSSVLLGAGETVTPYAGFDLSPVYAQVYTVKLQDLSLTEGTSLGDAYAMLQLETLNPVYGYNLVDLQYSIDGAPDPLAAGQYTLSVSGRLAADNGKAVDPRDVMLSTQAGTLTVEAAAPAEPVPEAVQPEVVNEPAPVYVEHFLTVDGSPYTQGSAGAVSFSVDSGTAAFSYDLSVDGTAVDPGCYSVNETSVTLANWYLDGLFPGEHNVHMNFADGYADMLFIVLAPAPVVYIPGVINSPWTRGSADGVGFTFGEDIYEFSALSVDGLAVDAGSYSIDNGSVVLSAAYLANLAAGEHSVHFDFTDGYADSVFTVQEPAPVEPVVYTVSVSGSPWTRGSAEGLRLGLDREIGQFTALSIDGSALDPASYYVDGSLGNVFVVSPEYLSLLGASEHSVHFDFTDGYGDAVFTVKDADPILYNPTVVGSPWVHGGTEGIAFQFDGNTAKFAYDLSIDSAAVDPANYSVTESAVVLSPAYLELLMAGSHSIHFGFTDGYADSGFVVEDPAPVVPEVYTIIAADQGPWMLGSSEGFRFQFDKNLTTLTGVTADGSALAADSFSTEGSIVILAPACLNALGVGTHSFDFLFSDGYTSAPGSLSIEQPVIDYTLTVSGSPWAKNTSDGLTLTVPGADMSQLLSVEVDSAVISSENYGVGANIVLSSGYLQQLGSQEHSVRVVFTNGSASGSFTVTDPVYHRYDIRSVSGSPWVKGSANGITVEIDANLSKMVSIELDGVALDAASYSGSESGLVLNPAFLAQQSSATHQLSVHFSDGYAETSIEITDPNPIEYRLNVSGSPWKKNTGARLDFSSNAEMSKLTSVALDGTPLSTGYSITGSTLSLDAAYLETLSLGDHSLKLNFSDGFANASFTVTKADPIEYKIIGVTTSPWVKASPSGLSFKIDADAVKFSHEVFIDNNKLPDAAFSTSADRTTVTISPSYMESLAVGKHEISFSFSDGFAKGSFAVEAPAVTPSPTPSPSPISYGFLEGTNTRYIRGSAEGMTLKVDADIGKFSFLVQVDGNQVNTASYTVTAGSTVVTLSSAYLNTLAIGSHTIVINFTDGAATALFTVEEAAPQTTPVPMVISGRNVSKTYDGAAYNLAGYGANNQGVNASFHLVQNGQWVNQAVNIGSYDIYLDSVTIANGQNTSYKIMVYDANGSLVSNDFKNNSVKVGTLSITGSRAVVVTVKDQAWTYDGQAHQLDQSAYTVEGLDPGDSLNIKLTALDASGRTVGSIINAGSYNIKAEYTGGANASKYSVTIGNMGKLTVNPFKLTLTAESASKAYDGAVLRNSNVKATGLVSGHKFRAGDGVKFSVYDSRGNLIKNGPVEVGTYSKKVTEVHIVDANNNEVTANYDITRVDGTLTIIASGNNSPKTGDQNNLALWIGLLLASALAVVGVLIALRLRSKKQGKAAPRSGEAPSEQTRRVKRQ